MFDTFYLPKAEYAKIVGEINTFYELYKGKRLAVHKSYGIDDVPYWYFFENYGFDDYNIYNRVEREADSC